MSNRSYGRISLFSQRILWGNTGIGSKVLSAISLGAGDHNDGIGAGIIRVNEPCDLFIDATVEGTDCDAVIIRPDWSPQNVGNFSPLPYAQDNLSIVSFGTRRFEIRPATAGTYPLVIPVPLACDLRIMAMREGGGADSALLLTGMAIANNGQSILSSLGGGLNSGSRIITEIVALDDGAGSPVTLTGAFQYGDWFWLGEADEIQLIVQKTTANDPDNVDLQLQTSTDNGTTVANATQIDAVSGGFDYRSTTIKRITDFTAAENNREILIHGFAQNQWGRVGARFVGGAAPDLFVDARAIRV